MILQCPTCRQKWPIWADNTVLSCRCGDYPVISSIPILLPDQNHLVRLIRVGDYREALVLACKRRSPVAAASLRWRIRKSYAQYKDSRYHRRAQTVLFSGTIREQMRLFFGSEHPIFDYYYYKWGTPRHLVALSVASCLPDGPVLDVGCGAGHITRWISQRHPTIGVDISFAVLYWAKQVAPEAQFVCCDVNAGLPFANDAFTSCFSANALHFFARPAAVYREMLRISQGPVAMTSLRHTAIRNNVPNYALSLEDYSAMLEAVSHCFMPDVEILKRYVDGCGADLSGSVDCSKEPLFTLWVGLPVGSGDPWVLKPLHAISRLPLGVNPLYREHRGFYTLHLPSQAYAEDNPSLRLYMPDIIRGDAPVDELLHGCVLVDMPKQY